MKSKIIKKLLIICLVLSFLRVKASHITKQNILLARVTY